MPKRIIIFGEVLFDCFPDDQKILGGAPFNVAWHLQAFKASPLFISRVGNDAEGDQIFRSMRQWGMITDGLQRDPDHPTGQVAVNFVDGEPEYDIVANSAWDFIEADHIPDIADNFILYHGSLGLRNQISRNAFKHLQQKSSAECFVDVNFRLPWLKTEIFSDLLGDAKWLKANEQELARLKNTDETETSFFENNSLELLLITRGSKGAQLIAKHGVQFQVSPEPDVNVVDTVGAGDAFSSIVLLGLLNHWSIEKMLHRALEFANAIVGIRGAISTDKNFYQKFINSWELAV